MLKCLKYFFYIFSVLAMSQNAHAFGCTSEGQATRLGKWKLYTAQNQTEVVSFSTSLAAAFLKPGDVVNVQDADRTGILTAGESLQQLQLLLQWIVVLPLIQELLMS